MPYKDRGKRMQYLKEYHKTHYGYKEREKTSEYDKKRYQKLKQYERRRHMIWYIKNIKEIKQRHIKKNVALKTMVVNHYTNGKMSCVKCGFGDIRALAVDHINEVNGDKNRIGGLGNKMYQWLKKNNYPNGYQILCFNCNQIKQMVKWGYDQSWQ